jgi:hypothetical protein
MRTTTRMLTKLNMAMCFVYIDSRIVETVAVMMMKMMRMKWTHMESSLLNDDNLDWHIVIVVDAFDYVVVVVVVAVVIDVELKDFVVAVELQQP